MGTPWHVRGRRPVTGQPTWELIVALGDTPDDALRARRWGRLCVAVCRRVQAVWELQSDADPLTPRIQAANDGCSTVRTGRPARPASQPRLADPAGPAAARRLRHQFPMIASLSVIWLVSLAADPRPGYAVMCVREADQAFYSSLGNRDRFRPWVLEVAVPAAWADRELTPQEQRAMRDYDMERVRLWRG